MPKKCGPIRAQKSAAQLGIHDIEIFEFRFNIPANIPCAFIQGCYGRGSTPLEYLVGNWRPQSKPATVVAPRARESPKKEGRPAN